MHASNARKGFSSARGLLVFGGRVLIVTGLALAGIAGAEAEDSVPPQQAADRARAESQAKEGNSKYAELDAALQAAKEKELAKKRKDLAGSFTVAPESAEGISLRVLPQALIKEEMAERWRMELFREDEIARKLESVTTVARLLVTWRRPDYDSAAAEHFKVIVSNPAGKVILRHTPDYRAPKQAGEDVYLNQIAVNLGAEIGNEFRVRVVDGNQKVYADFVVKGGK